MAAEAALTTLLASGAAQVVAHTLNTIFLNIICHEGDEKFRRLRTTNATLRAKLFCAPAAEALLLAVGFVRDGEFLVLPAGASIPEAIIARVSAAHEALGVPPRAESPSGAPGGGGGTGGAVAPAKSPSPARAPELDPEYKARLAELAKARAEKEAEKARIKKQMEEDQRERAEEARKKPVTSSKACAKGAGGFAKL
jgi:hypothetical protein